MTAIGFDVGNLMVVPSSAMPGWPEQEFRIWHSRSP